MSKKARAARRPVLGEAIASARAQFTRVTARKARAVVDVIRGLTVAEAQQQLAHLHRPSAVPLVERVLRSAVANVEPTDYEDDAADLVVGEIYVDDGPMLKRFRPRAMGRASAIRKRMAHLTVKLYREA